MAAVPTAAAALEIVRTSALVTAVPGDACRPIIEALGLVTFPLPVELRPVAVVMSWHERYRTDRAHKWLHDAVRQAWGRQEMMVG